MATSQTMSSKRRRQKRMKLHARVSGASTIPFALGSDGISVTLHNPSRVQVETILLDADTAGSVETKSSHSDGATPSTRGSVSQPPTPPATPTTAASAIGLSQLSEHGKPIEPTYAQPKCDKIEEKKNKSQDHSPTTAQPTPLKFSECISVGMTGRLFWMTGYHLPYPLSVDSVKCHIFSVDHDFVYESFHLDFGPPHLGHVYRFCCLLRDKMNSEALEGKAIILCSATRRASHTNSIFLICAYEVIMNGVPADDAYAPFERHLRQPPLGYRDATTGPSLFLLNVADCLRGLEYAISLGWFDHSTFDILAYERDEQVSNGDMNWIIPGKFLAFSSPRTKSDVREWISWTPNDYLKPFKRMGVKTVIRLNHPIYNSDDFTKAGILHRDMYFLDGSCPPRNIVQDFLSLTEACDGAVAVHCKAGLGRTGSLIGCYAIKNYRFTARSWIGWNRVCRPGSVLGPQQQFLCRVQPELWRLPSIAGLKHCNDTTQEAVRRPSENKSAAGPKDLELSERERQVADGGDEGQGDRLWRARIGVGSGMKTWLAKRPDLEDADATPASSASTEATPSTSSHLPRTPAAAQGSSSPNAFRTFLATLMNVNGHEERQDGENSAATKIATASSYNVNSC